MHRIASFSDLKSTSANVALERALHVDSEFCLIPVGEWVLQDRYASVVESLVSWRRKNASSFFSPGDHSEASMKSYLRDKSIADSSRILFLVAEQEGFRAVGHLGLSQAVPGYGAELDNVMRGVEDLKPDLMRQATLKLLGWAHENVPGRRFWLRVRGDNHRALRFYQSLGFTVAWMSRLDDQGKSGVSEVRMEIDVRSANRSRGRNRPTI